MSEQKPSCKPCNCYPPGTKHPLDKFEFLECDSETGQCDCLPGVTGLQCNRCEVSYLTNFKMTPLLRTDISTLLPEPGKFRAFAI